MSPPAGPWKRLVLRTVRMGGPAGSPRRPGAWVLGAGPGPLEGQNRANRTKSPAVRESAGDWPRPSWLWGHLATPWGPCAWEVSASPSWAQCHLAETPPPHWGCAAFPERLFGFRASCRSALSREEEEGRGRRGAGLLGPVGRHPAEAGVPQPAAQVRGGGVHQRRGASLPTAPWPPCHLCTDVTFVLQPCSRRSLSFREVFPGS